MRTKLLTLFALLVALPLAAQQTFFFQGNTPFVPVGNAISAVKTQMTPILIKYIGSTGTAATQSGTVEVDATTGDITLKYGVKGAEAVDTNVECDASIAADGARSGIIDVSTTPCDTFGEVVDIINASTRWRAVVLDGLRADSADNTLFTLAATSAGTVNGVALVADETVGLQSTIAMIPQEARRMPFYLAKNGQFISNPFKGTITDVLLYTSTTTYSSGTSTLSIISSLPTNSTSGGSSVVTTVYSVAGGATTVASTLNFTPFGVYCRMDEKCIVRTTNSAVMSASTGYAYGLTYTQRP